MEKVSHGTNGCNGFPARCKQVGYSHFRDTNQQQFSASISSYFSSQKVQAQLENAAGIDKLARDGSSNGMGMLEGALQTVNSKVHQLAEAGRNLSQQLQELPGTPGKSNGLKETEGEQHAGLGLMSKAHELLGQIQETVAEYGANRTAKVAAAVAGAVLAVATLQSYLSSGRSAAVQPPARPSPVPTTVGQPAASRLMSSGAAWRLIQQFQRAKARALGSEFDCSQLTSVLMGQALQHYQTMAHDSAARGWFRTSRLWKCEVQR
jgi:hypothetical protein